MFSKIYNNELTKEDIETYINNGQFLLELNKNNETLLHFANVESLLLMFDYIDQNSLEFWSIHHNVFLDSIITNQLGKAQFLINHMIQNSNYQSDIIEYLNKKDIYNNNALSICASQLQENFFNYLCYLGAIPTEELFLDVFSSEISYYSDKLVDYFGYCDISNDKSNIKIYSYELPTINLSDEIYSFIVLLIEKYKLNVNSYIFQLACGSSLKLVKYLYNYNIDINFQDEYDYSPIKIACLNGLIDIVEFLYEKGAIINNLDNEGNHIINDMIYISPINQYYDVIKFLINNGISPYHKNKEGLNSFELCEKENYNNKSEFLRILNEFGKKLD